MSGRIRTLLRRAKELGVAVHFDMEQYSYKDLTIAILKELLMEEEFRNRTDIGVTIQAYLRDSGKDLQGIIDWANSGVILSPFDWLKVHIGTKKASQLYNTTGRNQFSTINQKPMPILKS